MSEQFISEPIELVEGTFDTTAMTRGEPGLPERFKWRDKEYAVADVLEAWKEVGLVAAAAMKSICVNTGSGLKSKMVWR